MEHSIQTREFLFDREVTEISEEEKEKMIEAIDHLSVMIEEVERKLKEGNGHGC